MSPLLLRRYRAERLLREDFESLRERVLSQVSLRLRGAGAALDRTDLEAAYAQAWQGLYAAVLEGQQILNPVGWLTLVTYRRAIDEHRARGCRRETPLQETSRGAAEAQRQRDVVTELDDRARLRALLESWRLRLNERERQAAALCYLQGLSRAEAAARMGISDSRMRKLMDGSRGLRGVAAKVGALAQAIAAGEWCQEQGSLMRGLAFGILDPRGERHLLARRHSEQCSACRAYVLSLRGLAAALPPLPSLLQWALGTSAAAGTGVAHAGSGAGLAHAGSAGGASGTATGAASSVPAGSGLSAGALSASGAAAGAAGGSWWLAGGMGAKLAVGCLLALGVGAGCVALEGRWHGTSVVHGGRRAHRAGPARDALTARDAVAAVRPRLAPAPSDDPGTGKPGAGRDRESESARATREFGPEATPAPRAAARSVDRAGRGTHATARVARVQQPSAMAEAATSTPRSSAGVESSPPAATREFAPG
jgi:RNA polymerase sigma factor (sigma-70 family)